MRFSIQEDGRAKMFFHIPADAQKETGLDHSLIKTVLERKNSCYHRKSDNKLFFIRKEPAVKILTVQGKDFFFPGGNSKCVLLNPNNIYEPNQKSKISTYD